MAIAVKIIMTVLAAGCVVSQSHDNELPSSVQLDLRFPKLERQHQLLALAVHGIVDRQQQQLTKLNELQTMLTNRLGKLSYDGCWWLAQRSKMGVHDTAHSARNLDFIFDEHLFWSEICHIYTFSGTWYLPHSQVYNDRNVPIIMAGCIAHAWISHTSTYGLKSDITIVFLDTDFF